MTDTGGASASDNDSGKSTPKTGVLEHRAVLRVVSTLAEHGIPNSVVILPATAPTAAAAAEQLGVEIGAIANSLIFTLRADPLLVLTSGSHRVDTKKLGHRMGVSGSAIKRASPDLVKSTAGQAIGGVAPVGHLVPIRTIVDEELRNYPTLWVAGGHHQAVFPVDFDTLVRITGGEVMKVD